MILFRLGSSGGVLLTQQCTFAFSKRENLWTVLATAGTSVFHRTGFVCILLTVRFHDSYVLLGQSYDLSLDCTGYVTLNYLISKTIRTTFTNGVCRLFIGQASKRPVQGAEGWSPNKAWVMQRSAVTPRERLANWSGPDGAMLIYTRWNY